MSVGAVGGGGGAFSGASGIRDIMAMRQQIIDRSQVLQQVHATPAATAATGSATGSATQSPATGFTDVLQNALGAVNSTQNNADTLTTAYEQGKTQDVAKVMLARQEASTGFEATLQVRNKLLSAYQDIMKLGV